jgi:hypothetical protein
MSYTYIQLVNEVLVRLREREVTSVNDTAYSKLIGRFVNDAKRQAEDAYNWNALSTTLTAETVPDEVDTDIYYEMSRTYPVKNGKHISL